MKIGLQSWGSEGDNRPFIALAHGLKVAGHDVKLVYTDVDNRSYQEIFDKLGLNAQSIPLSNKFNIEDRKQMYRSLMLKKHSIEHLDIVFKHLFDPSIDDMYKGALKLAEECDLIIGHRLLFPVRIAADLFKKPFISIYLTHRGAEAKYNQPWFVPSFCGYAKSMWWYAVRSYINKILKIKINDFLKKNNLPLISDVSREIWFSKKLNLVTVSPILCNKIEKWDKRFHVCGFLGIPEDASNWKIDSNLQNFIQNGEPPVYVTFGSLMPPDADEEMKIVKKLFGASRLVNCRMIIQTSLVTDKGLPVHGDVFYLNKSPHSLVFPKCSAIVHHGAPGTIQTAILSGCPSIVIPHLLESFSWGESLRKLGLAPKPIDIRLMTSDNLAEKIKAVLKSKEMKKRAVEFSGIMKKENGVASAVRRINELVGTDDRRLLNRDYSIYL